MNKKTIDSATGQQLIAIIKKLITVIDADVFEYDSQLRKDIDTILKIDKINTSSLDLL